MPAADLSRWRAQGRLGVAPGRNFHVKQLFTFQISAALSGCGAGGRTEELAGPRRPDLMPLPMAGEVVNPMAAAEVGPLSSPTRRWTRACRNLRLALAAAGLFPGSEHTPLFDLGNLDLPQCASRRIFSKVTGHTSLWGVRAGRVVSAHIGVSEVIQSGS